MSFLGLFTSTPIKVFPCLLREGIPSSNLLHSRIRPTTNYEVAVLQIIRGSLVASLKAVRSRLSYDKGNYETEQTAGMAGYFSKPTQTALLPQRAELCTVSGMIWPSTHQ